MERCEGTVFFIFGQTEGELPRMTEQRHVGTTWSCLTNVNHGQPEGSPNGGVGTMTRTEGACT